MDQDGTKAFETFMALSKKMADLGAAASLLDIDMEISMPPKGGERRAEVCGTLAGVLHDLETSAEYGAAIDGCLADPSALPAGWLAVLRNAKRERDVALRLPSAFVAKRAEAQSACLQAWEVAREKSDFRLFLPAFELVVAHARESARLLDPAKPPYDVFLDDYEDGLTHAKLEQVFGPVEAAVRGLLAHCRTRPADEGLKLVMRVDRQKEVNRAVAAALGFDFEAGRLDVSAHPFTGEVHRGDVRMTSRYDEADALDSMLSAVHESGHGLYSQGLPAEFEFVSEGGAPSLGVDESQSRLYENMVAHSRPFLRWFFRTFLNDVQGASAERHYRAVNAVRRDGFIRVNADELTYPLHIILRVKLEKRLIEGSLAPADLPQAWNALFREMFGVTPPDDARGCLQDSHWPVGMFGYFPCYTLGDMRSAQIYAAAKRALPGLEDGFERGEFSALREWLREHIHRHGATKEIPDLMRGATGADTRPDEYVAHLTRRFAELYGFGE